MFRPATAVFLLLFYSQITCAADRDVAIPVLPHQIGAVDPQSRSLPNALVPRGYLPTPVVANGPTPEQSAKMAQLQQKLRELAQLQQEVHQLRAETRTQQQILVRVQMLEFSLTKMQKMGVELPGISSGCLTGADVSRMLAKTKAGEPGPYTPPNSKANSKDASGVVEWLTGNNVGKVLAEPTIVMLDGRPASFNVGGEIPMPAKDKSKVVEYQPIGTQLDLLATSLGDNRVRLELKIRISEADYGKRIQINGTECPAINVRQINTGIESTFAESTMLTGMIEKRIVAVRTEAGVRENVNEICTMLVVTPELVELPETAERPSARRTLK